jgi:hypothetical protein
MALSLRISRIRIVGIRTDRRWGLMVRVSDRGGRYRKRRGRFEVRLSLRPRRAGSFGCEIAVRWVTPDGGRGTRGLSAWRESSLSSRRCGLSALRLDRCAVSFLFPFLGTFTPSRTERAWTRYCSRVLVRAFRTWSMPTARRVRVVVSRFRASACRCRWRGGRSRRGRRGRRRAISVASPR